MKYIRIITASVLLLLFSGYQASSHPWKPNHYVIVDSDGGIDDIRSITLLLASPDVRVLGIIASPGALDAETAYIKIKSLLNSFYHEGIPVSINRNVDFRSPVFPAAKQYRWGTEDMLRTAEAGDFIKMTSEIFIHEKTPVTFICLGGLSSVNEIVKKVPGAAKQIKQVVWSSNGSGEKSGFNYNIDKNAAKEFLKSGVKISAIGNTPKISFDKTLVDEFKSLKNIYAKSLTGFFASDAATHEYSLSMTDELTAVWLHYPSLFKSTGAKDYSPDSLQLIQKSFLRILRGETVSKNQVIKVFPADPSFYFSDIESSVAEIIEKYGEDEWISGVIANELHRHLGVFAIVGVKMGIRAREFFRTGVDEFKAVSHAGSVPPLSCMNDGIQVSTGATPGHGLLTVINDEPLMPSVEFTYLNHRIRLTLKKEIASRISSELKEINFVYGLDSNIYWELVRKNSIKYWKELDRHLIFDIEVLQ